MEAAAEGPSAGDIALELSSVRYTYPARGRRPADPALQGVTLRIARGQTVALLGPNGSGKSTLIRIICGLQRPDEGSVGVAGAADLANMRRRLGVAFQTPSLDPDLTVTENLRNQAALYNLPRHHSARRIEEEVAAAGIGDRSHARVRTLSGGLQRRADLCRALLHEPPVLILDEPTVGLDPSAREDFLQRLRERQQRDRLTILLSTHLIDEAEQMDRVVLMHKGRIVADDAPAALRRAIGERRVIVHDPSWIAPEDQPWRRGVNGWTLATDHAGSAGLIVQLAEADVPFSVMPPTLADVFEHHTGQELNETVAREKKGR